jgi:glutamyl-tRNA reductase
LFQIALKTGKRVRTETKLSCGSVGHGQAALELIRQQVADISQARIAIIGANRLNQTIIKYLAASACRTVFLSNRTYERALELSQQLGCRVFRLERLREQLLETDVLVSATSAPHAIVRKEDVPRDHALVIVDLAVPRDAEEEIGSLPNIRLFNLDDVERLAWSRREIRAREILAAERIVEEEVEAFYHGEART